MDIIKLNDTQKKQAEDFLKSYRYIYVCNKCGNAYGSDFKETKTRKLCHICDMKYKKQKRKKW